MDAFGRTQEGGKRRIRVQRAQYMCQLGANALGRRAALHQSTHRPPLGRKQLLVLPPQFLALPPQFCDSVYQDVTVVTVTGSDHKKDMKTLRLGWRLKNRLHASGQSDEVDSEAVARIEVASRGGCELLRPDFLDARRATARASGGTGVSVSMPGQTLRNPSHAGRGGRR